MVFYSFKADGGKPDTRSNLATPVILNLHLIVLFDVVPKGLKFRVDIHFDCLFVSVVESHLHNRLFLIVVDWECANCFWLLSWLHLGCSTQRNSLS